MTSHIIPITEAELSPILSPLAADILTARAPLLHKWTEEYGSPLHLVLPSELDSNVEALRRVLDEREVGHAIYYGSKVNKSSSLMQAALGAGAGIDVSSVYELRDAVKLGARGNDIVATGPAKTAQFHDELVRIGALICVDGPEELTDISKRLPTDGVKQPVLLRLQPKGHEKSRFGMAAEKIRACLSRIASDDRFRFDGIHFHLSGYRWEDRAVAFEEAVKLVEEARAIGLSPTMIDIGGGLPVQYVSEAAWEKHLQRQGANDFRTGRVPASFYPYGGPQSAAAWLGCFLGAPLSSGQTIENYLKQRKLTLAMEPGRSLVDQAAISAFRITRVKDLGGGNGVIFVEGSSFSACETWFASEFMVDPILLRQNDRARAGQAFRAYIAGHSCLDEDVLSNRWFGFPQGPEAGDLLVWANTGGYQMDLLENEFHRHPMPKRLCVTKSAAGELSIYPDN
ncbi:Y4yA family PLP-dependent enzyme (plasmid) [Rhizobium sp. Pop5]|uniref:Y4yA family PLP-dependent enzyme n=1 Tax=Rhizobium sp. Pop5 TaxID=1223565 RepID=UPI00028372D8|nr:Y4yA family PLP-dependent enzyme [Rhizobium sp. Pop5]EJZ22814.1 Orn/DAP/Arg decarboxylase 2 [Rhizobium sp. Pop5]UVD60149.1 Y4yA family PLP-dependent enzyme [Rhizobium sp. Pop5]